MDPAAGPVQVSLHFPYRRKGQGRPRLLFAHSEDGIKEKEALISRLKQQLELI